MSFLNSVLSWLGIESEESKSRDDSQKDPDARPSKRDGQGSRSREMYDTAFNITDNHNNRMDNNSQYIDADLRRPGKIVNIHTTAQLKLVVLQPKTFEESRDIADHLKQKKPVVVNLEGVDMTVAKKIIDFLSGAVYALDGNIQKVSAGIFLIAPYNVGIMGDVKDELYKKAIFPWQQ